MFLKVFFSRLNSRLEREVLDLQLSNAFLKFRIFRLECSNMMLRYYVWLRDF